MGFPTSPNLFLCQILFEPVPVSESVYPASTGRAALQRRAEADPFSAEPASAGDTGPVTG